MGNQVILLGCAAEYLPVIFDLCYETYGSKEFHIFKNIEVDSTLELPNNRQEYKFQIHEPEDSFGDVKAKIFFGVTGPFGKQKVFDHFKEKWKIERESIQSLIHPASILAPSAEFNNGVLIEPGVIISSQTTIGFGVTIKRSVSIGHHCRIGDYVEINPGATISGEVEIGEGSIIGSGTVLRDGISIGRHSIIGMGSVVTKNIPDHVVAYGSPCEIVRKKEIRK